MTIALSSLATACDGTGVSDRSAAVLKTLILHDVGIVSPINLSKVIDRCKIRRERRKTCNKLQQNNTFIVTERLFFNEGKNKSFTQFLGQDNKRPKKTLLEEHIIIVVEPNASYLSHRTPKCGSSKDIIDALLASLK